MADLTNSDDYDFDGGFNEEEGVISGADLINDPKDPIDSDEYQEDDYDFFAAESLDGPIRTRTINVGEFGLGSDEADREIAFDNLEGIEQNRADQQSGLDQFGNFLAQAVVGEIVGGTIEGLGYLFELDSVSNIIQGQEADWGNWMTELGQGIREGVAENTQIHQDPSKQGQGMLTSMTDSGWWAQNSVSVASTLSMMIPSMAATKGMSLLGKGMSKGLRTIKGMEKVMDGMKMSERAKWMTEGLSQAVVSRNIENFMEGHGTYEDVYNTRLNQENPATGETYTEEEARKEASDAAAENYRDGWAMLLQDIPQYLALGRVFNPVTAKLEGGLSEAVQKGMKLSKRQQAAASGLYTFGSEGFEESYQYIVAERAKLRSDLRSGLINQEQYDKKMSEAYGSDEMKTSAFFGGLGGNVFQAAGKGVSKLTSANSKDEYQKALLDSYNKELKNRATSLAAMQQEISKSDIKDDATAEDRQYIMDNHMVEMIADSINNDKFDSFMENLDGISKMSEEEKAVFKERTGQEFNSELADTYIPGIKEKAKAMKKAYLKIRNTVKSTPAAVKIAKIDILNDMLAKKRAEYKKEAKESKDKVAESLSALPEYKSRALELQENIDVTKARIAELKKNIASNKGNKKAEFFQEVLDIRLAELEKLNKSKAADKEIKRTPEEKEEAKTQDKAIKALEREYNKKKAEIIDAKFNEATMKDMEHYNNLDAEYTASEKGQKAWEGVVESAKINEETDIGNINESITKTKEIYPDGEKKDYIEKLEARKTELENIAATNKALEMIARDEAERQAQEAEKNNNPETVDNQKPQQVGTAEEGTVTDGFEDASYGEEVDTSEQFEKEDKRSREFHEASTTSIPLLDKSMGTKNYELWSQNTVSKIGTKFKYGIKHFNHVLSGGKRRENQKMLMKMLEEAHPNDIPRAAYDDLFIEAVMEGSEKGPRNAAIYSDLPMRPVIGEANSKKNRKFTQQDVDFYESNYASQRKIIIDRIKAGQDTTVEVKYTSGGGLVTTDEQNSVLDLQQINGDPDKVEFLFTDDKGKIIDTDKNVVDDFAAKTVTVGSGEKNIQAYKGGVFVKVRKADGTAFPLRVELAGNTEAQAFALARILTEASVGSINENGEWVKPIGLENSYIENLDELDQTSIKEAFGPELELLGNEATLKELVDIFIHFSDGTKGLTSELYADKGSLFFAKRNEAGKLESVKVTAENKLAKTNELSYFLQNVKKRQISINLLNSNPEYKKYLLENRVVTTNGVSGKPLFQATNEHPVKNYMSLLTPGKPSNVATESKGRTYIPIRTRPKSASEEVETLTGKEAEAAELKVEKIINDGINKGQTLTEIEDRIFPRFGWNSAQIMEVQKFIKGKVEGSIKENFATWRKPTQQTSEVTTVDKNVIGPDGKTYKNLDSLLEKFPDYNNQTELSTKKIEEYKNTIGKIKTYNNLSPQENLKKIIKELLPNRDVNKIMIGVFAGNLLQGDLLDTQDVLIGIDSFNELKNEKKYNDLELSTIIKNIVDAIKMKDIVLSLKPTQQSSEVTTLESNLETEITKELKNKTFKIGKVPFKTIELKDVNLEIKKVNDDEFTIAVNNKGKTLFDKTTAVLDFQKRDLDSDNIYIPNPQGFILWNKFLESDVANMSKSKVIVDNRFNITLGTLKGLKSSGISKLNFPERFVENFKNEYSGLLDTNFSSVSSGNTSRLKTVEVSIDDLIRILSMKSSKPTQQSSEVQKNIEEKDLSFKKGKVEIFTLHDGSGVKGTSIVINGQPNVDLFTHKEPQRGWTVIDNKSKKVFPLSGFFNGSAGTKGEVLESLHRDIIKYSKDRASKKVLESIGFNLGTAQPAPKVVLQPKQPSKKTADIETRINLSDKALLEEPVMAMVNGKTATINRAKYFKPGVTDINSDQYELMNSKEEVMARYQEELKKSEQGNVVEPAVSKVDDTQTSKPSEKSVPLKKNITGRRRNVKSVIGSKSLSSSPKTKESKTDQC